MSVTRIGTIIAALIVATVAMSANAACRSADTICVANSPWFAATQFTVQIEFAGTSDRGSLSFSFAEPGSMAIDSELADEGVPRKRKILLLDNQLLLTNFEPERDREIYALDSPVLIYQLAITLLSTAYPEGPQDFKGKSVVDLEERKRGIAVATSSTTGLYRAPWRATGSISRRDPQSIDYAFDFESQFGAGQQRTLTLKGVWTKSNPVTFDPALSLKEWNAYMLDGYTTRQDSNAVSDGARPISKPSSTLGELQQILRETGLRPGGAGIRR